MARCQPCCSWPSKFAQGAWVSLLVILAFVALFATLRRGHERIELATRTEAPLDLGTPVPVLAVVPIRRWDQVARKTLRWALSAAKEEVLAVQILADNRPQADLAARWHDLAEAPARRVGLVPPRLVVLRSDYRGLYGPLVAHVTRLAAERPDRQVAVIVPELVEHQWYRALFPFDFASVLRAKLLYRGGPPVVVVSTPWYVRDWADESGPSLPQAGTATPSAGGGATDREAVPGSRCELYSPAASEGASEAASAPPPSSPTSQKILPSPMKYDWKSAKRHGE